MKKQINDSNDILQVMKDSINELQGEKSLTSDTKNLLQTIVEKYANDAQSMNDALAVHHYEHSIQGKA